MRSTRNGSVDMDTLKSEGTTVKLLFLRGQVPQDRDPRQIMFDSLEECDDVWTQLAARIAKDGYGEAWYWGGRRRVEYRDNFVERWLPSFGVSEHDFDPDVIFARGGFSEYDQVMHRHPGAFKVYYGAGRRFLPASAFTDYDLILNDSPEQLEITKKKFPHIKSSLFVKPAAENIFRPEPSTKQYDVIFVGNEMAAGIKGHAFMLPRIPKHLKAVQVGIASKKIRRSYPNIHFTGWIPRDQIPAIYGKSKVAICGCDAIDSCPRVIPESLACGCPLLVLDSVKFWHQEYITSASGMTTSRDNFATTLSWMVENYSSFSPREHYCSNLSLDIAANGLMRLFLKSAG